MTSLLLRPCIILLARRHGGSEMKKFILEAVEIVFDMDNLAQIIKIINLALGLYFLARRFLNRRKRK